MATTENVWDWWRNLQPDAELARLALALWTVPTSQGEAERYWAELGRQTSPIRSRLESEGKRKIMNVSINAHVLKMWDAVPAGNALKVKSRKLHLPDLHQDGVALAEAAPAAAQPRAQQAASSSSGIAEAVAEPLPEDSPEVNEDATGAGPKIPGNPSTLQNPAV